MTIRGTILIGLLLCAGLLAGTRLAPAPSNAGTCVAIEVGTNEIGDMRARRVFEKRGGPYAWSVVEGILMIQSSDRTVELLLDTVGIFNCQLPMPTKG